MSFDDVKALMRATGSMEVGKGASEADVAAAEKALGVPIPGRLSKIPVGAGLGWSWSSGAFRPRQRRTETSGSRRADAQSANRDASANSA